MCGRFNVASTPGLQALLATLGSDLQLPPPRFNIAPTEQVGLLREQNDKIVLNQARWWLTPHWAKELGAKYAMFNARSEGLASSPAFRKPFASQRGIVFMSDFIEWRGAKGSKRPWLISNKNRALAVAALWDLWQSDEGELLSCTLVTTEAAPPFKTWHSRMPVMLARDDWSRWLDNTRLIASDDALFAPTLREPLLLSPLDTAIGNARNKGENFMESVGDTIELAP